MAIELNTLWIQTLTPMRGARYTPKLTETCDFLSDAERIELRRMLEVGLTMAIGSPV